MNNRDIRKLLLNRPETDDHPERKNYKLLPGEIELISLLRSRFSLANLNETEVVRAAIRALEKLPDDDAYKVIGELPKVSPGRKKEAEDE
jgi:hypothetical protein